MNCDKCGKYWEECNCEPLQQKPTVSESNVERLVINRFRKIMIDWIRQNDELPESGSEVFFYIGNIFYKGWFDDYNRFDGSGYFYSDHSNQTFSNVDGWVLCEPAPHKTKASQF